jgi:benzoate 4-monooxygenase
LGNIPWIIPYINKVLPYLPIPALQKMINGRAGLRQVSALLSLDAWGLTRTKLAITSVNRRIAGDSRRKDLLGRLLEELQRGVDSKGNVLDVKDIQTEAFGFIVAGSHTTADPQRTTPAIPTAHLQAYPIFKLPFPRTSGYLLFSLCL